MIQPWCVSNRFDRAAKRLADRHYNRQTPDSPQFAPPGSCVVFLTADAKAFWITSYPKTEFTHHKWAGAWICSAFRSEGAGQATELITAALAATRAHYGDPPDLGLVTFLDARKVEPILTRGVPTFGRTWVKAGFRFVGKTKRGLLAFQILPRDMPSAIPALPRGPSGLPIFDGVAA